jgi:Uma2 family endonuclease
MKADPSPTWTAERLLGIGDLGPAELVEGRLIMMSPAGGKHGRVALSIAYRLEAHASARGLGLVLAAETGFLIARDPDTVRAPDAAFVAAARVPPEGPPEGYWPFAPDLAVEVVSPSDRWTDVESKVASWLGAGTRLVWVADPNSRRVHVYRPDRDVRLLSGGDVLVGEDVLPGLSMSVAELFA